MPDTITYWNGDWVPFSEVKIDPHDRGFMVADTVFDAARTFNGKGFRFKEHVDRLYRSLNYARLDPRLTPEEMLDLHEEAVERNRHFLPEVGDFVIWPFVTRGLGRWASTAGPANVCIEVRPIDYGRFLPFMQAGAHGVIPKSRSYSSQALDPKIKHYSRMNFNLAELEAKDVHPDAWPILLDDAGNLSEGIGYNVFLVTDGTIKTAADSSILQGISRMTVYDLAEQLNIPVSEEELQPYDLYTADEVFFSGTSYCVMPVTRVDRREIGDGKPGPVLQQLLAAWGEMVGVDIIGQAESYIRPEG